jgi:outer membrane immunogenic protein
MKKLTLIFAASFAALGVTAGSAPAFAADMALKAPPVVAPVWSWNGWYAGLNVGGSFGEARDSSTFGTPAVVLGSSSAHLDGVIGGGQVGYNTVTNNWLIGLEADIQGSSERSTGTDGPLTVTIPGAVPIIATGALTDSERLEWFGTVRGRLGVLSGPNWLFYGTGGLAYGDVRSNETLVTGPGTVAASYNTIRAGWTAGAGIEGVLGNNWTVKLEYLYIDLGRFSNSFTGAGIFTPMTVSTHVTDNIVRVGLNYHFH